mmetsp:Transcript_31277/g.99370  ORF Transcript_31277/g.99370 Transcript_31277/m.99370 type:complete len:223 (+) Transcript_31277:124-792(+)
MSPTRKSIHFFITVAPPSLNTRAFTSRLFTSLSALWRFTSSKPSLAMVIASTIMSGRSVEYGVSGLSNKLVKVPMTMSSEITRKYTFASRRNCSKSDRGMNVATLYLYVYTALSGNCVFSSCSLGCSSTRRCGELGPPSPQSFLRKSIALLEQVEPVGSWPPLATVPSSRSRAPSCRRPATVVVLNDCNRRQPRGAQDRYSVLGFWVLGSGFWVSPPSKPRR